MAEQQDTPETQAVAWFEYWPWGGGYRARPVHWKGWLAVAVVCLAPGLFLVALGPATLQPFGPFGMPAAVFAIVGGVMTTLAVLFRLKGRPRAN